jgi:hypothetical protein
MNKEKCMTSREIDVIVNPFIRREVDPSMAKIIKECKMISPRWNYDKFWEDALSIFAEQFNKE